MEIQLECKQCKHRWTLTQEPRLLQRLACPTCDSSAEARASEDLASAIEDALCQLWLVGKSFRVNITLDTGHLPRDFQPPDVAS